MATAKATAANDAGDNIEVVSADDIERNVERVRGDIAALAQSISKYGAGKGGEYKARAGQAGKDIAKMSQETLDSLTKELAGLEKTMASQVRQKPLQSLGIAAGVGFLIAMLLRR
ncbi:DUF883 family protein [Breoghania sp. L-A4]|uniref:DUF883 family protein n=1 Tax=Breoghania sp. L-A4 TaxID=2304600 RepID=UPI000E35FD46|nr:DUF883 family protein [Breoghania sp. L-A4]AXS40210.1 DUF883 family protein [Breoghania sp. L-A4]